MEYIVYNSGSRAWIAAREKEAELLDMMEEASENMEDYDVSFVKDGAVLIELNSMLLVG